MTDATLAQGQDVAVARSVGTGQRVAKPSIAG